MALTDEEKVEVMRRALALFFDCDEEEVGNFVIGVERSIEGNAVFSAGYSVIPRWYLLGLANELVAMLEQQREIQTAHTNGDRLDQILKVDPETLRRLTETD